MRGQRSEVRVPVSDILSLFTGENVQINLITLEFETNSQGHRHTQDDDKKNEHMQNSQVEFSLLFHSPLILLK